MKKSGLNLVILILGLIGGVGSALGSIIVSPEGCSTMLPTSTGFSVNYLYDQSGLSLNYVSGVTDADSYLAQDPTHRSYPDDHIAFQSSNLNVRGAFVFYVSEPVMLDKVIVWTRGVPNSATSVEIYPGSIPVDDQIIGSLDWWDDRTSNGAHVIDVANTLITDAFIVYVTSEVGNQIGLGEVAMVVVPEPYSTALIIPALFAVFVWRARCVRNIA